MSDHFRKGGVLVNAVFHLGMANDSFYGLTDGVFIFEAVSPEDNKPTQGYDAIVVEQWTVLEVSVALEGSVSTKQIVFLQRPCLPQKIKKRESKFQWRFSREETRGRQTRKSKGKRSARDKQQAEENEKNLEEQFPKAGDVGNCVLGTQQRGREKRQSLGAVQNGPAGHSRDSVVPSHSNPRGEDELASGPAPAEAN
ncbi:Rftn1 [Phodopus roborovskii]|uniref:Rftn1 protein n=1 Tax=Phodopus roborovskii TaxID=109678 RepID=A0AAV0A2X0_PHORO|nr:Rftn1 [Phodopus roborovskii]